MTSKIGILIVNTKPLGPRQKLGSAERNLMKILGPQFDFRVISALEDLNGPVKEQGIIFAGSPYSVLDETPWMENYRAFMKRMIEESKFILGICFGMQALMQVHGHSVKKAPLPQVGYHKVQLTREGQLAPLFRGLPQELSFPSFHFDHVAHSGGKASLAQTSISSHYASQLDEKIWGVQFHPEMSRDRLIELVLKYKEQLPEWEACLDQVKKTSFGEFGHQLLRNWGDLLEANSRKDLSLSEC